MELRGTINRSRTLSGSMIARGLDGRGIVSIAKTGTSGLVDTYTITYTDATTSTFTVTNGANGQITATSFAEEFSSSKAYAVGDYVVYSGQLYQFTTAHAAGAWNASHATAVQIADQVSELKSAVDDIDNVVFIADSQTITEDQLLDSFNGSFPKSYKWVISEIPADAVVSDLRLIVQGNSTAIVELEKWEWSDNDNGYVLAATVPATSVSEYSVSNCYTLTFAGFTTTKKTLLSFSDTSSAGWVRYLTSALYTVKRFSTSLSVVTENDIVEQSNAGILYYLKYTLGSKKERYSSVRAVKVVDPSGNGDYTTIGAAISGEPENTVIFVKPGVYNENIDCRTKRIILIGADRTTCILRSTDGRYEKPPLWASCGYFENLTFYAEYVNGTSQEIDGNTSGSYAVHFDADGDYAVGKSIEFHHCTLKSDFFPALGLGLRKNCPVILDDCELVNNQVSGRGTYSGSGSLGALFFHDQSSSSQQGNDYITVKNCVLKSSLGYTMTPYQAYGGDNKVYCEFIGNVLHDDVNGYSDNIWYRGDPFNSSTGVFEISIGFGNSNSALNNN